MIRTHEQGYSLIELLVVLALLGLITVAVSSGIGFGARVWERVQTTSQDGDRLRGTQNFLRLLIGHVYPRLSDPNATTESAAFVGDATHLSFLSVAPEAISDGSPTRVELRVDPVGDGFALEMNWQGETGAARSRTVLSGLRALTFSFGVAQPNGEIIWSDIWDGKIGVPALVRLRAASGGHAKSVWPEFLIHPMIDKDAACIYDAVSFSCRHG